MKSKIVLITGNLGYVGVELVKHLKLNDKNLFIIGYDTFYFKDDIFKKSSNQKKFVDYQINSDIRGQNFRSLNFFNIDTIIHLAAISNDPMGNSFVKPTREINNLYSKKLIDWAKKSRVKKFIFASSCSVYGFSDKICNENSKTKPLTEYAKSKLEIEKYLKRKATKKFKAVSLRFSTACGASEMLRLDLVLNDFVASAITSNKVKLLSDGKALRPLIDVLDMAKSFRWADKYNGKNFECVNVGSEKMNYRIVDLANLVQKSIPKSKIFINKSNVDNRSYRVNFSKYRKLFSGYNKMKGINYSITQLIKMIKKRKFKNKNFRNGQFMRLISLRKQIINKKIDKNLKIIND